MSQDATFKPPVAGRLKTTACALAALLAAGFSFGSVAQAQDATPAAMAACTAPALPPGTPTMQEEGGPPAEGTPAEDMGGMDMGSPEAAPPAPTRAPEPTGTAADEATTAEIDAAVDNVVACVNSTDDGLGAASVMTASFMMAQFDTDNAYDVAANMAGMKFDQFEIIGTQMTYEDGRVSANVQYYFTGGPFSSKYQLNSERWYLAKDGDTWKLDEIRFIPATTDLTQSVVGVTLTQPEPGKYAIETSPASATATELLTLHAINNGTEVHELVMIQLPEGKDPTGLLDGSVPFEEVTVIGGITPLFPQDQADMNLVNLPAGKYFLVCFISGPDGAPHVANGMWVEFDVTAAG